MEPEHRRRVRSRLAELLGQALERVTADTELMRLVKDPRKLGSVIARLQQDLGVRLDAKDLLRARTVNHLVTLLADAAREAQRGGAAPARPAVPPAPEAVPATPVEKPAAAAPARAARGEVWESSLPYETTRIKAAAVYCSDGRIGLHLDDLLHNGLGLPRYDRLACPGGPASLSGRLGSFWECRGVEAQLRFLVDVHDVEQVVLVAHQPCAYYLERLRIAPEKLEAEQLWDLQQAAAAVQRIRPELEVAGFVAWVDGSRVRLEKAFASPGIGSRVERWRPSARG